MTSVSEETRLNDGEQPKLQQEAIDPPELAPQFEGHTDEPLRVYSEQGDTNQEKEENKPEDPVSVEENAPHDSILVSRDESPPEAQAADDDPTAPIATTATNETEAVPVPGRLTEEAVEELNRNDDNTALLLERLSLGLDAPISNLHEVVEPSSSLATNPSSTPTLSSEFESQPGTASLSESFSQQIDDSLQEGLSPEEQNELINVRLAISLENPPHVEVSPDILDRSASIITLPPSTPHSAVLSAEESSTNLIDMSAAAGEVTPTNEYPPLLNAESGTESSMISQLANPSDSQRGITEQDLPTDSDPQDMLNTRLELGLQTPVQAKLVNLPDPTESVTALPPSTPRPEDLPTSSIESFQIELEAGDKDALVLDASSPERGEEPSLTQNGTGDNPTKEVEEDRLIDVAPREDHNTQVTQPDLIEDVNVPPALPESREEQPTPIVEGERDTKVENTLGPQDVKLNAPTTIHSEKPLTPEPGVDHPDEGTNEDVKDMKKDEDSTEENSGQVDDSPSKTLEKSGSAESLPVPVPSLVNVDDPREEFTNTVPPVIVEPSSIIPDADLEVISEPLGQGEETAEVTTTVEPEEKRSTPTPSHSKLRPDGYMTGVLYVETPAGSDHSVPVGIPGATNGVDYLSSGSSGDLLATSEPPQIVSSAPKDGLHVPIHIRETRVEDEGRPEVQRLLSTTPEAPTSPRDELQDTSHIATPIAMPVAIPESIPPLISDANVDDVPTVQITAPEKDLDFVEDARSERSVGTSVAPIAPNSPRFITPIPTPSMDSTTFSLYQLNEAGTPQPLTAEAVERLPESTDPVSELAPELKEALDSSVIQEVPLSAVDDDGEIRRTPLEPVAEDSTNTTTQLSNAQANRPRHSSTPSTWSIHRTSGWFHPGANIPGRPSLEIVEGEFSRPQPRSASAAYPPDKVSTETGKPKSKDDSGCIIF
ncbi:hypothetical protein FRC20_002392 [Serendipita sp. 405]|nr:hypothetical protein FRC20_002392 [Serendipita sp. 405]